MKVGPLTLFLWAFFMVFAALGAHLSSVFLWVYGAVFMLGIAWCFARILVGGGKL
jgi:hypothetical protein